MISNADGYIAGRWVGADSGRRFRVNNPLDGSSLAEVPDMGEGETRAAIESAERAVGQASSVADRQNWLSSTEQALLQDKESLGRVITLENGKPLKEGIAEVAYAAGFFGFFARHLQQLEPEVLPEHPRDLSWTVYRRPAGVAGLITPWNFPLAMLAKKMAAGLGAGCGIVTKPASQTPLSAIALHAILDRLGLPAGQVNLITGSAGPIGQVLCRHPSVRVISFTGSTATGKLLASQAAPHLKRMALELGGNAPFIVFADADLDQAADGLLANKFRAGGQTCVCTNRVYAHRSLADRFAAAMAERTARLKVGDGLEPETDIGPLINREGFDKVAAHVKDALDRGAQRLVGHDPPRPKQDWAAFYPPTVLAGVRPEMLVCREETFGPVVAISSFDDEAEVIELANSTPYGLAAYVFTREGERARRVIRRLRFGHVGLNTGSRPAPEAPFGGMKESGFGREGGLEGLLEFCETQVVAEAAIQIRERI